MKILEFSQAEKTTWFTHLFHCPGCGTGHGFNVVSGTGYPVWTYNNDPIRPTIRASILVRWPTQNGMHICHSFITDGQIDFLSDSTHALAGQTVELPDA